MSVSGEGAEALETRALQLHYTLLLARRREAARMRSAARTLHACANSVVALHTDVCRLRRGAARARHARRFRAAHARLLQLAEAPAAVSRATATAEHAAAAVAKAAVVVPCAEGLAAALTPPAAPLVLPDAQDSDPEAARRPQRCVEALRALADGVARATRAAQQLATLEAAGADQRRTLDALRTRQAFLDACRTLGLDRSAM